MSLHRRHIIPTAAIAIAASALFPAFSNAHGNLSDSVRELTLRADSGDAKAAYSLAKLYESGYDSIPADTAESIRLYRRAADAGLPEAQNYLGYLFYLGKMVKADTDSAVYYISQAALNGDLPAANNLGFMFMEGERTEHDDAKAAFWFEIAAEGGIPSAITQLADLTAQGRGVAQDSLRAENLYLEALDRGFSDAAHKLWRLCGDAWLALPDEQLLAKGIELYTHGAPQYGVAIFEKLADKGNSHAEALLGDAHSRALGTDYNYEESLRCYFNAAKGGNPSAAFFVAETLEFFPDALNRLPSFTPADADPSKWYGQASDAGITDAKAALTALLRGR